MQKSQINPIIDTSAVSKFQKNSWLAFSRSSKIDRNMIHASRKLPKSAKLSSYTSYTWWATSQRYSSPSSSGRSSIWLRRCGKCSFNPVRSTATWRPCFHSSASFLWLRVLQSMKTKIKAGSLISTSPIRSHSSVSSSHSTSTEWCIKMLESWLDRAVLRTKTWHSSLHFRRKTPK